MGNGLDERNQPSGADNMSSKDRMSTQDIIKNSTELKESGMDWKRAYVILHLSIENNQGRIFRCGNTLFWIVFGEPHEAQMFVFNADSYKNLLKNFKEFAQAMHKAGFKKVWGETHDKNIIEMIKRLGFPVDVENIGQDSAGRTIYRGTVNV